MGTKIIYKQPLHLSTESKMQEINYIEASTLLNISDEELKTLTAKQYVSIQNKLAKQLNAMYESIGSSTRIDAPYWADFYEQEYKGKSAYDYIVADLYSVYSDLFKEQHNFRPRCEGWERLTIEQLKEMIDRYI